MTCKLGRHVCSYEDKLKSPAHRFCVMCRELALAMAIFHCRRWFSVLDSRIRHRLWLPTVAGRHLEQGIIPGVSLPDSAGRLCRVWRHRVSLDILLPEEDLWSDQGRLEGYRIRCTVENASSHPIDGHCSMLTKLTDRRGSLKYTASAYRCSNWKHIARTRQLRTALGVEKTSRSRRAGQDGAARARHAFRMGRG